MGLGRPIQARPVDMGLPSGLQWASCNVGAAKPSDLGLYFSWGNIEGHRINEGYDFSQATYDSTPAAEIDSDLTLDQDAARANLGLTWRMPTITEFRELIDNCTNRWVTIDGVEGVQLISNVNGNTLFFPAAGVYIDTSLVSRGLKCLIWSSSYTSTGGAHRVSMDESVVDSQESTSRRFGLSVRAVIQPT